MSILLSRQESTGQGQDREKRPPGWFKMPHAIVNFIRDELQKQADPEKSRQMAAYMKNQQAFYGVQAKPRYQIFREAIKKFAIESPEEYRTIVLELWRGKFREERYQALEVAGSYKRFYNIESWELYLELLPGATWWDTLDWLAGHIMSPLVARHRELESHLIEWRQSDSVWTRRASLLAHLKHKDQTNTGLLAETILLLAHEKEFFIRKAIGWVLREYSKANPKWVQAFVTKNRDKLSGLSKREALKRISTV